MMIHDPSGLTVGTAADHEIQLRALNTVAAAMAGIYADRTGKPIAAVRADMLAETWLDPVQCVIAGYATGIVNDAALRAHPPAPTAFDYGAYRHAPQALMALATAKHWGRPRVPVAATAQTSQPRSNLRMRGREQAPMTPQRAAVTAMFTADAARASMERLIANASKSGRR